MESRRLSASGSGRGVRLETYLVTVEVCIDSSIGLFNFKDSGDTEFVVAGNPVHATVCPDYRSGVHDNGCFCTDLAIC